MRAQPTPKDVVFKDGIAELLHFRPKPGVERSAARPLLLVPSIINRWYVLDLFEGSSVVEALVAAGIDASQKLLHDVRCPDGVREARVLCPGECQ